MLAILWFMLLSAENTPCQPCTGLTVGHLPVTHWGQRNISENTALVNPQSLFFTTELYWENTILCVAPSPGSLPASGPGEPGTGPAPSKVLAGDTCSSSRMTNQPAWLQQKFLSSNPNYSAGTALRVVF